MIGVNPVLNISFLLCYLLCDDFNCLSFIKNSLKCVLNYNFTEGDNFGGLPFDPNETTGKIGAKKMRKLEMKAEKKALREVHSLKCFLACNIKSLTSGHLNIHFKVIFFKYISVFLSMKQCSKVEYFCQS